MKRSVFRNLARARFRLRRFIRLSPESALALSPEILLVEGLLEYLGHVSGSILDAQDLGGSLELVLELSAGGEVEVELVGSCGRENAGAVLEKFLDVDLGEVRRAPTWGSWLFAASELWSRTGFDDLDQWVEDGQSLAHLVGGELHSLVLRRCSKGHGVGPPSVLVSDDLDLPYAVLHRLITSSIGQNKLVGWERQSRAFSALRARETVRSGAGKHLQQSRSTRPRGGQVAGVDILDGRCEPAHRHLLGLNPE